MQQRLTTLFRQLKLYAGVFVLFLCIHGVAFAQRGKPAEPEAPKNVWILGYFVVGLGITLGMLVLCRSSRRNDRAKPQGYQGLSTNE